MNQLHRWLCRSSWWDRALRGEIVPWVLEGVALGDDLLELGPGPGLTTDILRTRVASMTAIDVDGRLAGALATRLGDANVRVLVGDATAMPFAGESFSAVVSMTMLHHVPSPGQQDRLLAEAYRVLRPAGTFAGTDTTGGLGVRLLHVRDTMVLVDPDTFGARLETAGFRDVAVDVAKGRFRFRARRPA
jgi:ubiquinone/menaquinone biosynthesis C-methylase UbiE